MIIELRDILSKLENSDSHSVDETVETLLQLHLKYSDCIWHIDQIHELVKKRQETIEIQISFLSETLGQ